MKDFFYLLGWKDLIVVLLALLIIRISIIIPFYSSWFLPATVSWEYFIMFAFGICFILAGNNVLIQFSEEKRKVLIQNQVSTVDIKQYPDLIRLRGMWIVFWFVGAVAVVWSYAETGQNILYLSSAIVALVLGHAYANFLRTKFLAGNIALALIYSSVVLSQLPNDWDMLVPLSYNFPNPTALSWNEIFYLLIFLAALVFVLTLIRDITGDVTNTPDDKKKNYSTIGVKLGEKKSKTLLYALSVLFILLTAVFLYYYKDGLGAVQIFIAAAIVIIPIIYYMMTLQKAQKQTDYNYLYVFLGMIYISLIFVISFCKYLFINGNIQ
ncbi:MAG: hypothetical protein IJ759_07210 [Bacteroidales bacterium]|nr:hypothetical protein [Bacteroidales bacterium]